jgi:hypothetical protein
MQLVQYRTAQVLSIENILAAQIGTRLTSTKVQRSCRPSRAKKQ